MANLVSKPRRLPNAPGFPTEDFEAAWVDFDTRMGGTPERIVSPRPCTLCQRFTLEWVLTKLCFRQRYNCAVCEKLAEIAKETHHLQCGGNREQHLLTDLESLRLRLWTERVAQQSPPTFRV